LESNFQPSLGPEFRFEPNFQSIFGPKFRAGPGPKPQPGLWPRLSGCRPGLWVVRGLAAEAAATAAATTATPDVKEEEQEQQSKTTENKDEKGGEGDAPKEEVVLEDTDWKDFFQNRELPDISDRVLSKHYASFTLPSVSDGFDDVSYVWEDEDAGTSLFKEWILERKLTQRVDDLVPGAWFQDKSRAWSTLVEDFKAIQSKWNSDPPAKESSSAVVTDDIDVFAVEDIKDIGNKEPLFARFDEEDWILLETRYELHLLLHAVRKDLNDPDRPRFPEKHLQFYYDKYFRKVFDIKYFNVAKFEEFQELIKDVLAIDPATTLLSSLCDEETPLDRFVKATEQDRRDRQQRADAGDETAKLRLIRPPSSHGQGRPIHGSRGGRGGGFARSGGSQDQQRGGVAAYRGNKPRSGPPPQSQYRSSRGGPPPSRGGGGGGGPPAPRPADRGRGPVGSWASVGGRSSGYSGQPSSGDKRPYRGSYSGGGSGGGPPKSQRIGMSGGGSYGGRR